MRGICAVGRGRVAMPVFLRRQELSDQQMISAIGPRRAIQLVREFDGFASEAALGGQGRKCDGVRS
jgi:hypothetical protein